MTQVYSDNDYTIHDVTSRHVAHFLAGGKTVQITRVTIFVGNQGPFTQDFGPGQDYPDTIEAIQQWKQQMVTKAQATASR